MELQQDTSNITELARLSPLFKRIWNAATSATNTSSYLVQALQTETYAYLQTSLDDPMGRLLQRLDTSPWWPLVVEKLSKKPLGTKLMVAGSKNAGKSTFARYFTNALLTSQDSKSDSHDLDPVFWMDLDPGQPEFGMSGQLSLVRVDKPLLGPNFTRLQEGWQIVRSHALGCLSPRDNVQLYLKIVRNLMRKYTLSFGNQNLIINCPGWTQGGAFEVLAEVCKLIMPSDFVYLGTQIPPEIDQVLTAQPVPTLTHCLPPQHTYAPSRSAAELRTMQSMSHFHALVQSAAHGARWDVAPLMKKARISLSYGDSDGTQPRIMCAHFHGEQPEDEFVSGALDGTVIALMSIDNDDYQTELDSQVRASSEDAIPILESTRSGIETVILDPSKTSLITFAFVAEIEKETRTMHFVMPQASALLLANILSSRPDLRLVASKAYHDTQNWIYLEEAYLRKAKREQTSHLSGLDADAIHSTSEDLSISRDTTFDAYDISSSDEDDEMDDEYPWISKSRSDVLKRKP